MTKTATLQDALLRQLCQDQIAVTVFLVNGFQMRGRLIGYDSFVVVLETDGRQQMIYKHAVSTVVPARALALEELAAIPED